MAVEYLVVAAGGAVGAPLRYLTDRYVQGRWKPRFPWATFAVNVAGSFLLGVLAGAALVGAQSTDVGLLLGVGLCGALTTYSTLSWETARLVDQHRPALALANMAGSIVAGLAAVSLGYAIAAAVTG